MKQKLLRYLFSDQTPNLDSIRLWKCNFNCNTRDKLSDYLKQNDVSADKIEIKPSDPNEEIEQNSGFSFPGQQFDTFLEKEYRELDRTSNSIHPHMDLIVVEQPTSTG